jgi:eukaryotic-like serine/threonine-protein kinase
MTFTLGKTLGPYEILAPLGAGGMGEVYRARDTRLDRTVAIKVLPQEMSRDPLGKQRFEREAKIISSLNHPHICVLHDVGSQDGVSYLVMECLEGETLAKRLEKGPLPLEQVLKYGAQIADALDKAHRGDVVHRDLKPGNIMLAPTGAKLLDFGLAKPAVTLATAATLTVTTPNSPVTEQGTIVGTFQYMSPEQVEGKELDGRSDIFSFGAVLYEMVTGKRAFEGKSQLSVASAILEKEPAPISTTKPLTPPALDYSIRKCLAKTPDERWQSASDLKSELNWIVESGSQAGAPASVVAGRQKRERVAWIIAAVAIATLVVLLVSYFKLANLRAPLLISTIVAPPDTRPLRWPRISPDGKMLLLVLVDTQGKTSLWLRPLKSPSAEPLPGTDGASQPFWSPDGRSVGFFADGKLKTVEAVGGPVFTVCDAPFPVGGSWNKEGSIIFVPNLNSGIYKVPVSGGSPTLLLGFDKSKFGGFGYPDFLPDGRHFTYSAFGAEPGVAGTYFASLDGRENKRIAPANGNRAFSSGYLFLLVPQPTVSTADLMAVAFNPVSGNLDGEPKLLTRGVDYLPGVDEATFTVADSILIYASSPTRAVVGPYLVWLDRSGKKLSAVAGTNSASDMRLAPDAQKVAYAKGDPNSDIWVQELKRDVPMRLTFDTSVDKGAAVWSPDGSEIVFDITPGGKTPPGIYRKSASGMGQEKLLAQPKEPDTMLWPTDWSRDGKFVLCVQGEIVARNRGEIWVLPLSDRKPRVFIHAPAAAYDAQFSPDGHWVAYVSRESGREEVYVVPFDGNQVSSTLPLEQVAINGRWQVSPNGGAFPRWRRDGKELFYVAPGDQFVSVAVETKGNSFSPGETHPLFREPLSLAAFPYDVSPDGQRFLVNSSGDIGTSPFTLVMNWQELLKNK